MERAIQIRKKGYCFLSYGIDWQQVCCQLVPIKKSIEARLKKYDPKKNVSWENIKE